MSEPLKVVLLHCQVQPVWVTVDAAGRPVATHGSPEAWLVPHAGLAGLQARIEALEVELTAVANREQEGSATGGEPKGAGAKASAGPVAPGPSAAAAGRAPRPGGEKGGRAAGGRADGAARAGGVGDDGEEADPG